MPDIGPFHPQIVHFVVALLFVGVPVRLIALTGKIKFAGGMATTLLVGGALAATLAVESGDDAHGPAERIPGARDLVEHHEEAGKRTRNAFLAVAVLELAGLALRKRSNIQLPVLAASGGLGLFGLVLLYDASEHGGEIVYEHAGGVGTRSGDPMDVSRLLLAGLYNQAALDREAGRSAAAAELTDLMGRRYPRDRTVQYLVAESMLRDLGDSESALAVLARLTPDPGNRGLVFRAGMLRADAYEAAGHADSARTLLTALQSTFPDNERIAARLNALGPSP